MLSPGKYEVIASLSGFKTAIRKDITLSLASTLAANFALELSGVSETIAVLGQPPLIDASTTAVSNTIPPQIISNLPKTGDIQNLIALTPGVSDDLVAYGANSRENAFLVDGVKLSSPFRGQLSGPGLVVQYDQNWIDQVQVIGIGAPAEYGNYTGVLASFVTRSGGNQFHGLFETFFQNQNLTSTNVPNPRPKIPFKTYDISAQLGGPILHDKLWFFSGFEYPHTQTNSVDGGGNPILSTNIPAKFITKLTYKWNDENTLQGFVHFDPSDT